MTKAVIYARFSSELQNQNSCRDQIRLCEAYAERHALTVIEAFTDEAISGASMVNRFGLGGLMRAAKNREFDVLICEALDRLSRDQADLAQIRKELKFYDIAIQTVQDGEVTAMHIGLKGLMGEMYLADLAQKTRRGLESVVADGRQAGGKSYGYDLVEGKAGELSINQREAEIVQRIFDQYAQGKTPRQIAGDLNAEGIPSPRGGKWNASTINGSKSRKNGVLQNQLYRGQIIWNRQRFLKDPATGKRISRLNPESEWVRNDAPHLRIIEQDLFDQVQLIKTQRGSKSAAKSRKPKHLLSGLTKCGHCGASYTVVGYDRIGCAGFRERKDCSNNRTVQRQHIEQRVLVALEKQLAAPEHIAIYVKAYHEERKRLAASGRSERSNLTKRLHLLTTNIDRIVDKIVEGTSTPALDKRLVEMEHEKQQIEQQLAQHEETSTPVELHPGTAEKYRRIVADLQNHLTSIDAGQEKEKIFETVRELIDRITIYSTGPKQPVDIEVTGTLATLLGISVSTKPDPCGVMLVAGARNSRYPKYRISA